MLESLIYGSMLGDRDSEVILGLVMVFGFILEFAIFIWLGFDIMELNIIDIFIYTLIGYLWGA